jgi:RNase P subunit RPR2
MNKKVILSIIKGVRLIKNISNTEISSEKCTKCATCGKPLWYVMKCDCGHIFCKNCSATQDDKDSDSITLECPKCGQIQLYV